jgi:hypothetical protein
MSIGDRDLEPTVTDRQPGRRLRLHRTDGISLTFGLVFLGAAVLWLIARLASLNAAVVGWMVVCGLFVLGGLGLATAIARVTRRRDPGDQPP